MELSKIEKHKYVESNPIEKDATSLILGTDT
jgi:hypothetical protein